MNDSKASPPASLAPDPASSSPERFEPDDDGGTLVHAEHLARYLWAAQVAGGRTVLDAGCGTGYGSLLLANADLQRLVSIDNAAEAVAQTAARLGGRAEVLKADVRELPFADRSFDMIVCFEVIEHIREADRALAEFARTLRPEGVLLISSPNPRLYLQGNPHHVHEYAPEELQTALEQHFTRVTLSVQRAWLGSLIAAPDQLQSLAVPAQKPLSATLPGSDAGGEGTYALAAAGHHDAQLPEPRLVFGEAFEVKWWMDQVAAAENRTAETIREREILDARCNERDERLAALEARLVVVEQDRARLLSERPELEQAAKEVTRARAVIADLQDSISWKLTMPLRSAKQLVRRARRRRP